MSTQSELGLVLVISGPSGVGKDTVWKTAKPCLPTFERAITCTTRIQRPHEVEGVDYYFVPMAEFERMIAEDELVEHAEVHGNFYGVPVKSIFSRINEGKDVVCVIDVQGALTIRRLFPQALLVFIKPPEGRENEVLAERITGRSRVEEDELIIRLGTAQRELSQTHHYDYQIVNDDLQRAADELCNIIEQEKAKRKQEL